MAAATSGLLTAVMVCALTLCVGVRAAPARTRVTADQRQSGELNIHASLENVVIVFMPSSGATDLLTLAGLKRPGLLQALLNKKHNYGTEEGDHNDINTGIVPPGDLGQEEVVATVEEMKPQTTERVTDPPRAETAEDPGPVKEQSTVAETVQETVINITTHKESEEPVKVAEDQAKKENSEQTKEKEDALSNIPVVDITPKTESYKTTETPTKEVASTPKSDIEPSMIDSQHKFLEKDTPKESSVTEPKHKSLKKDTSKESSVAESKHKFSEKDTPKESSVKESQPTITDLIRPVSAKESNAVESTSSKKMVEEDKMSPVKKVGDSARAADTRREKALKYQVETKWAPGLVGLLGPQERGRYAGLCAPGRWDPELRTCLMPGETRSRAELARFLGAMRLGIAVPTK